MQIYSNTVPDRTKNACAVKLMRNMLVKYALKHNISSEEAMLRFAESMTYDLLFDFNTEVWKEGPDYLLSLYEDELSEAYSQLA